MIPIRPEDIDSAWLSEVLSASIDSCQLLDRHSGTTGRALLSLQHNHEHLPSQLFVKLPPVDPLQRQFVIDAGMGRREVLFYQRLAAELPIRVPRAYFADSNSEGSAYIMLLEDLEQSGCTFRNASTRYSIDYVKSVLEMMAMLHGRYWQSERFANDLDWLQPAPRRDIAVDLVGMALEQFGAEMPEVFSAMAKLYRDNGPAIHALWNRGQQTLVHGDVHDGNFFYAHSQPGLLDWAIVGRMPAMRDVAYFMVGTLKPDDRLGLQVELLDFYRQCLLRYGGPDLDPAELWQQYQWHAAYVWLGTATTMAMGDKWQPLNYTRKAMTRLNQALADLEAVEAIERAL